VRIEVDVAPLREDLLRDEHDLPRVVAHVLDDMDEHAEAVGPAVLHLPARRECFLVEGGDEGPAALHDAGQPPGELGPAHGAVGGELEVALPVVGLAAQSAEQPLREVAAEVEDQVADAVGAGTRPPPDLVVVEPVQAVPDLAEILVEVAAGESHHPVVGCHLHLPRP
jgi:hypothetical protein